MRPNLHEAKPHVPWNKDRLVGQKAPLKLKEIWAIRIRLQLVEKMRDLALFNLAIDSTGLDAMNRSLLYSTTGASISGFLLNAIVFAKFEVNHLTRHLTRMPHSDAC